MIKDYPVSIGVLCACCAFALGACGSSDAPVSGGQPVASGGAGGSLPVAGGAAGGAGSSVGGAGSPPSAGSGAVPSAGAAGASAGAAGAIGIAGAGAAGASGSSTSGGGSTTDPGTQGDGVRTLNQPFNAAPEINKQDGVPHGKVIQFTIAAKSSQRYPKAPAREVNVYVPTQYVAGRPAPVIVVQDGNNFFGFVGLVSNTLDNLINAGKLPPIVAVFANNGGGDAQGSERGLEYDTLSGLYAEWVDAELLPRAEAETKAQLPAQAVTFTKDPEGRAGMGGSSGGIAAFIMAWYHPDLFRRALTFSPSFVAQEFPINPAHPLGAWNFHEDGDQDEGGIIAKTDPIKPIRVWMECGTNDLNGGTEYPHYDLEFGARRSELKMAAKGYHVHLDVGNNAAHVDGNVVKATLPEAMLWVWRGYQGTSAM